MILLTVIDETSIQNHFFSLKSSLFKEEKKSNYKNKAPQKMVLVHYNQQIINVDQFLLDTEETLFNRIVWALQSIPQYVWISSKKDILISENVYPEVLPQLIQRSNQIDRFMAEFGSHFSTRDIIWQWKLQHPDQYYVLSFQPDFTERFKDTIYEIEGGVEYQAEVDEQFHAFNFKQQDILTQLRSVQQLDTYTITFTQNPNIQLNYTIATGYFNLESLFNRLETSEWIPVITYKNYYKILNHFVPRLDWLSSDTKITGKIQLTESSWADIFISSSSQEKQFIVSFTTNENLPCLVGELLNHFLRHLGGFEIINQDDIYTGSFLRCDIPLKNYIFSDIVFTKDVIRNYISVNDNVRFESEFSNRTVYISLNDMNYIILSMTIQSSSGTQFKVTKLSSNRMIQVASDLLSRIVGLYRNEAQEIQSFYSLFIPEIADSEPEEETKGDEPEKKKRFFKNQIPAIFISKGEEIYSRRCQKEKQPVIITEQEAQDEKNQVILFPKESDSSISTPQYYTCTDPVYSHIGLIPFQNELGVAPCCFKTSQLNKPRFKAYYQTEEQTTVNRPEQPTGTYIIKTNKVILDGSIGLFPSSDKLVTNVVGEFLTHINVQRQPIVRLGVTRSRSSFLECILVALNQPTNIINIMEERIRLGDLPSTVMCAQEMCEQKINTRTLFQNPSLFLDPKFVVRQLEYVYKCNILLFYRTKEHQGMLIPPHQQGYCTFKRNDTLPSIFVYVHSGSETDLLEYPQCELICTSETQKTWEWAQGTNAIYKSAWRAYDAKSRTWFGKHEYIPVPLSLVELYSIEAQFIDSFGKVRLIRVNFKGYSIDIQTSPLPPFDLPLLSSSLPRLSSIDLISEFIQTFSLKRIQTCIIRGELQSESQTVSATDMRWNVQCTFNVDSPRSIIPTPESNHSMYKQYIVSSKLSRYLTNWVLFLFSHYIYENNLVEITSANIKSFVDTWFMVDPFFQYDVNRVSEFLFPDQAQGILRNGKIVCTSNELVKRLVYQLRLLIERDRKNVSEFRLKQTMDSYYIYSFDYFAFPNEVIVLKSNGLTSLSDLVQIPKRHLFSHQQPGITQPYFLHHPEITSGEVALTQNTESVEDAYLKMVIWLNDGCNKPRTILYEEFPYFLFATKGQQTDTFIVGKDEPLLDDRRIALNVDTNTIGPVLFI
jgi:hypothetical protein